MLSCLKLPDQENTNHTLPVVNLDIDEQYLWSEDSGLYVVGTNGLELCERVGNYFQKWEYPANIRFSIDGIEQFHSNVGFRIKGKCSRIFSQKSIGIYWRKEYGESRLNYRLYEELEVDRFKRLVLRNSGNDFGRTHLKDACFTQIFKDHANVDYQAYKPVVVYLNDEYWGIYNLREMITPHHFKYHYSVDDDELDLLTGSEIHPLADDGSVDDYLQDVVAFLNENSLTDPRNYIEFSRRIDIESYMDYMIIQTYLNNADWPLGNVKWWRDKTSFTNYRWRWVVYDTDFAFRDGLEDIDEVWIGDLYHNGFDNQKRDGYFILNHLLKNARFRENFLDRYLYFIDVVFAPERASAIITNTKNTIEPEYQNHQRKWNTLPHTSWENKIDDLKTYNKERNKIMKDLILSLINE